MEAGSSLRLVAGFNPEVTPWLWALEILQGDPVYFFFISYWHAKGLVKLGCREMI